MQLFFGVPSTFIIIILISIVIQTITIIDIVKEINSDKNNQRSNTIYLAWLLIVLLCHRFDSLFHDEKKGIK